MGGRHKMGGAAAPFCGPCGHGRQTVRWPLGSLLLVFTRLYDSLSFSVAGSCDLLFIDRYFQGEAISLCEQFTEGSSC